MKMSYNGIDYDGREAYFCYVQSLKYNHTGRFIKNLAVINLECHQGNILYIAEHEQYQPGNPENTAHYSKPIKLLLNLYR